MFRNGVGYLELKQHEMGYLQNIPSSSFYKFILYKEERQKIILLITPSQVSFLALDDLTQETFNEHGHHFQRAEDITKVRVHPVTVLSDLYKNLGKSDMLGLSGRHGILTYL